MKCADTIVIIISTSSLFCIFHNTLENNTHEAVQNINHPINIERKDQNHDRSILFSMTHHCTIIPSMMTNNATDVPSLKRLSHSKINASLLGAPTDLNIDKTATGSVALISEANNKHTKKGIKNQANEKIKYKRDDIMKVDINNPKIANQDIVFQFFNKSR